jgi:hypothetical protein
MQRCLYLWKKKMEKEMASDESEHLKGVMTLSHGLARAPELANQAQQLLHYSERLTSPPSLPLPRQFLTMFARQAFRPASTLQRVRLPSPSSHAVIKC